MTKNTGITRLLHAARFSWQGFRSALHHESAFRQECIVAIPLVIISFYLDVNAYERLAMLISLALILIIELINSALECAIDRISTDHHVLSGRAKDYGSLAVLLSLIIAAATWAVILY